MSRSPLWKFENRDEFNSFTDCFDEGFDAWFFIQCFLLYNRYFFEINPEKLTNCKFLTFLMICCVLNSFAYIIFLLFTEILKRMLFIWISSLWWVLWFSEWEWACFPPLFSHRFFCWYFRKTSIFAIVWSFLEPIAMMLDH